MKSPLLVLLLFFGTSSCKNHTSKADSPAITPSAHVPFTVDNTKIYNNGQSVQFIGVNAFHIFSAGGYDMNTWNVDIVREFIGNVKEISLSGDIFKDSNGSYLYPLQTIVDSNRIHKRITILCPFRWNGNPSTDFTGTRPTQTSWWNDFKTKLKDWAIYFKDQPDVWLELWNEPYRYDRADGYTDEIWLADMNELVGIIRGTGNSNLIVVPCAEQGQDESVLIHKGTEFLSGKTNIVFDVHAYEKWLLVSSSEIGNRLEALKQNKLPVIFGEIAPHNASVLMNPNPFLDSLYNRGLSVCAWVWKYDASDQDALLDSMGLPNDMNNNNWGNSFKTTCLKARNP